MSPEPPANAWVESVDFAGQILEKGTPIEFRAVVATDALFASRQVDVELEVDGNVVDRRRVDLGAASRVALTFQETFGEDGIHAGAIVMRSGVGLPEDDRLHFTLRTERDVPVLVICDDERSRRYLEAALAPEGEGGGGFSVRISNSHELESAARSREAVIVIADVERLEERELSGLKRYLSEGGGLLVFPGPKMDAAQWGRSFLPKFLPGSFADLRTSDEPFRIAQLDSSHPLFQLFREGEGGVRDVQFTRSLHFRPQAGTSVLATFSIGDPALVESSLLPGRVLMFLSSLDPQWSDLPLTGAFLPLIHEAVRYLSETGAESAEQLEVGDGATVWLPAVPEGGSVVLRAPGGDTRMVAPQAGPGGYGLELPEATQPGVWVFESAQGDTLAALAASIASRESDPVRLSAEEMSERIGDGAGAVLEETGTVSRDVREARIGREVGRYFLWAAVLLLLAESLIAARFRGPAGEAA